MICRAKTDFSADPNKATTAQELRSMLIRLWGRVWAELDAECCGADHIKSSVSRWENSSLPAQYQAYQILIKHKDSRRVQSNRDPSGEKNLARTVEQAEAEVLAVLAELATLPTDQRPWRFSELARELSDDAPPLDPALTRAAYRAQLESGSVSGKGSIIGFLDWFGSGQMAEDFEYAVADTAVGGLVGPVRTDFGVHLILRTG